jgi:CRISPR-associated protein Csd2
MSEIYCEPDRRHDFVYFFDVTDGNPNGDPDAGNMPRVDPETMHGIVTDVCIKRKVRDYVSGVLKQPIFIQSETALNTLCREVKDDSGNPVYEGVKLDLARDKELKLLIESDDGELAHWLSEVSYEGIDFDPETNVLTYSGDPLQRKKFGLVRGICG